MERVSDVAAIRWGELAAREPELCSFGAERLGAGPAYLATTRADGTPRVHPVSPIVTTDGLYLFMEPTSPKGRDLREGRDYALHNGVPDREGTGGEFWLSGSGESVDDAGIRAVVAAAAPYDPADRYVLFELYVARAACNAYGDVILPATRRWAASAS
jgi:hypothetical protein